MKKLNPYKPLPDCVMITYSKIDGQGIIAKQAILEGEKLGITHIYSEYGQDGLIRTPIGAFVNHSDDPNCILVDSGVYLELVVTKRIQKGEELTVSYRGWYDDKTLDQFS